MSEHPAKNPDWSIEETRLALALYLQHRPTLLDDSHPKVRELSAQLRKLAALRQVRGRTNFRNPNGGAMKLGNLSAHDPEGPPGRAGLRQGATGIETAVWSEFAKNPAAFQIKVEALLSEIHRVAEQAEPLVAARSPKIFVTGFWGFDPTGEAYVGFTHETTRNRLLNEWQDGDLMLIVGVKGQHANVHDVGRCLGLVELEPRAINDYEGASPDAYKRKLERYGADRWKFALPIKKAWFIAREVKARHIAPDTCSPSNARAVATSYRELAPDEADRVMGLPIRKATVFGRQDWIVDEADAVTETTANVVFRRGPTPSFGTFSVTRTDGESCLYLLIMEGPVDALFPSHLPSKAGKAVVKIGRSNDPIARCAQLNAGFPPESKIRWRIEAVQRFKSGDEAHAAESAALADLISKKQSLGNEFGLVPTRDLPSLLARYAGASAFRIIA